MVVKRQKSNADINGQAVAVTNGSAGSGALIQSVSTPNQIHKEISNSLLNSNLKKGS